MITTSGRSRPAMATASRPSPASPTTAMPGSGDRHIRNADRING